MLNHRSHKLFIILLISVLLLTACGSNDNNENLDIDILDKNSTGTITEPVSYSSIQNGTYNSPQYVSLHCSTDTESCQIHYTTDGTIPTTESNIYVDPIIVAENTTLRFFSIDNIGTYENDINDLSLIINTVVNVPAPVITTFTASSLTLTSGESTPLTALFSDGTATIDQGVGSVESGVGIDVSPTTNTTYTLTVTNSFGFAVATKVQISVYKNNFRDLRKSLLNDARWRHTSTLLPDGRVLILGGTYGTTIHNSAEIYDPVTGNFTMTASPMNEMRSYHTTTLLADGQVLIAGGSSGSTLLDSAEIYDPATDSFTLIATPMTVARIRHTATLLSDNRVLILGGYNDGLLGTAEIYDPVTNSFTAAGTLVEARDDHTATVLLDGRVLIAGGINSALSPLAAEIYDPLTNSFIVTGYLNHDRENHTTTLLNNGQVLIAGGTGWGGGYSPSAEIYDPESGMFTLTGSMGESRAFHAAVLLPDGQVLITGGGYVDWSTYPSQYISLKYAEIYDPISGEFTSTTDEMSDSRSNHTVNLMADGRVLIVGGTGAEFYDPDTGRFYSNGTLFAQRTGHTSTLMTNGQVLIAGGKNNNEDLIDFVEVFNPSTEEFNPVGRMLSSRYGHTATLLSNGKILYVGGGNNTAEIFDPTNNSFVATGTMSVERSGHTATLLIDGKVLIAGGRRPTGVSFPSVTTENTLEIYDPETNHFTVIANMTVARSSHTATLLPDGRVLIAGGYSTSISTSNFYSSAEIYDPSIQNTILTNNMTTPRGLHTATLLANGSVLITGGFYKKNTYTPPYSTDIFINTTEIFDPIANSFTASGNLIETRISHTATTLFDGRVLITGGHNSYATVGLDTAEIYDLNTGSFTSAGSRLNYIRNGHTAVMLLDGRVLLGGGIIPGGLSTFTILNSAEVYE